MREEPESEEIWLRFFVRRLRVGLRYAKSPDVKTMLKELIAVAEERLERVERQSLGDGSR